MGFFSPKAMCVRENYNQVQLWKNKSGATNGKTYSIDLNNQEVFFLSYINNIKV